MGPNEGRKTSNRGFKRGAVWPIYQRSRSTNWALFYYDASQLDSLKITLQVKDQTLVSVLVQVFKDTEFKFSIDDQQRVFVTSGQPIITQLSDDLFNLNTPNKESEQNQYVAPTSEEQDKLLSTAESKLYNIGAQRQRITEGKSTVSGYVRMP